MPEHMPASLLCLIDLERSEVAGRSMAGTWRSRFHRPSPVELATCLVTDMTDRPDQVTEQEAVLKPRITARQVLEEIVLQGLQRPPCLVTFSGGRDSSSLLAVSMHVARREGLPMPVAFTFCYDGEEETNETSWQELVIKHLGVDDWEVAHVGDRQDMLGPLAQPFLLAHGLVFPPTMYTNTLPLARARGGTHISGEGGDEMFGVRRSTILRRILNNPKYVTKRAHLNHVALALGPRRSRIAAWRRALGQMLSGPLSYLHQEVREQFLIDLANHLTSEPFAFSRSLGWHLRRKMIVMLEEGLTAFSEENDVLHLDPFLEPRFAAGFARMVGPLGLATRTDCMRALFSDVLPDEILSRTSKAVFNRGFLTDISRAFARSWDGEGVDKQMVDPAALRSAWLSEWPPSQSFGLLQAAWFHAKGVELEGLRPSPSP
jgi:asparagine synthetase B (glutamine-hydrolysing)